MADLKLPSINRIEIAGRITQDIEIKHTPSGAAVCRISVAVDRSYKDANDQWQKQTTYFNCVAWAKTAELLSTQCKKGMAILLDGEMTSRKYEKDGQTREAWEINIRSFNALEWMPKTDDGQNQGVQTPPAQQRPVARDDVPF